MTIRVVYPQARQEQASLPGKVASHRQVVIINRRNAEPAALIAAKEHVSLTGTAHRIRVKGTPRFSGEGELTHPPLGYA